MCAHGSLDRGDCSHVWTGLAWGVRPPTKVSPSHLCFWFCFIFFLYIYFFVVVEFYFIFNSLFSSDTVALLISKWCDRLLMSGSSHCVVGSVWLWLYCIVNIVGISLFEVCWWLHQTGVKKQKQTKKNPTNHPTHTKSPACIQFQTLLVLFLIIKPESCNFFPLYPLFVDFFVFLMSNLFVFTKKGRAWGGLQALVGCKLRQRSPRAPGQTSVLGLPSFPLAFLFCFVFKLEPLVRLHVPWEPTLHHSAGASVLAKLWSHWLVWLSCGEYAFGLYWSWNKHISLF